MATVYPKGHKIKQLRNELGITQEVLAHRAKISKRWCEKLECGHPADDFSLAEVARQLDVEVDEIIRPAPSGDQILGREWNIDAKVRKEKTRMFANGLGYEVYRIPSRSLPGRFARGKLYNLDSVAKETKKKATAILQRHPLICHKLRDVPGLARHITSTADEVEGFWWVLDDWTEGDNLFTLFDEKEFCNATLRCIGLQLLETLDSLHAHGIVRRELTLRSAVLSSDRKQIVLTDFETGKLLEDVPTVSPKGRWLQNAFLAPEVIAGADVDARSDWYSWAQIMLHGYCRTTDAKVAQQGLTELPPLLQDLFTRCLSPAPSDRPRSSSSIMREFKKWKGASQ